MPLDIPNRIPIGGSERFVGVFVSDRLNMLLSNFFFFIELNWLCIHIYLTGVQTI